jgi:hypothetical protein
MMGVTRLAMQSAAEGCGLLGFRDLAQAPTLLQLAYKRKFG